ncbi:12041_t:CDS:2, partial [Ambispora leptoticha]
LEPDEEMQWHVTHINKCIKSLKQLNDFYESLRKVIKQEGKRFKKEKKQVIEKIKTKAREINYKDKIAEKEKLKKQEEEKNKQKQQKTQAEEAKRKNQEEEIKQKEQEFKKQFEEEQKQEPNRPTTSENKNNKPQLSNNQPQEKLNTKELSLSLEIINKFPPNFNTKEKIEALINPIKDNIEFLHELQTKHEVEDLSALLATKSAEKIIKIIKRFEYDKDKDKKIREHYGLKEADKLTDKQIDEYLYEQAVKGNENNSNHSQSYFPQSNSSF